MARKQKSYPILEEDFPAELVFTDTGLEFTAPYNKEFLTLFKEVIRPKYREWDAEQKTWIIHDLAFAKTTADLVRQYFPEVIEH